MKEYKKRKKSKEITGRSVEVFNGNVEQALRKLKKIVAESGVLMKAREKETFTKPSVQRKIDRAVAKKRWQKYLEKTSIKKK